MSTVEPNWDLLPDDPVGFFGLSASYEHTELKRAYTRLIRVFKPERHPDLFQRIREAYDVLDERLRYGGTGAVQGIAWSEKSERAPRDDEPSRGSIDALALLREQGAAGTGVALRQAGQLDGQNWCRLALVEDALDHDQLKFCETLIKGTVETGGAPEVVHLLQRALHEKLGAKEKAKLLKMMLVLVIGASAPLTGDGYWFLTESLWVDLALRAKFAGFASLLEQCSREVGEGGWSGRLVLLTALVRKAAFRADDEWLKAAADELGAAYHSLPAWEQASLDLTDWFLMYRGQRGAFVAKSEFRAMIDSALVSMAECDEVEADRRFLEAQVACLDSRAELFAAFPPDSESEVVVGLLHWYAQEVAARRGADELALDPDWVRDQCDGFTSRLVRRTRRSWLGFLRRFVLRTFLISTALLLLGAWGATMAVAGTEEPIWYLIPTLITGLVLLGFARGWFWVANERIELPFVRRFHKRLWRDMTADFLAETHVPLDVLARVVEEHAAEQPELNYCPLTLAQDEGLQLYAMALRFAE